MSDNCQSCSMTIESGPYCQYCATEDGTLIAFDECVTRFMQFVKRGKPDLGDDEARRQTMAFMATMPAWKDHPEVRAAQSG